MRYLCIHIKESIGNFYPIISDMNKSPNIITFTYVIIYAFIEYLSYLLSFYTNPSYQTPHLIWGNIILRHIQLCNESSRACNVILFPTRCGIISELLKDEKMMLYWYESLVFISNWAKLFDQ